MHEITLLPNLKNISNKTGLFNILWLAAPVGSGIGILMPV
jgi:hypothetical protein